MGANTKAAAAVLGVSERKAYNLKSAVRVRAANSTKRGREGSMSTIPVLERLDTQDQTLHRIESSLAAIAETLFSAGMSDRFEDAVAVLLAEAEVET
jgi:hypothetical protein